MNPYSRLDWEAVHASARLTLLTGSRSFTVNRAFLMPAAPRGLALALLQQAAREQGGWLECHTDGVFFCFEAETLPLRMQMTAA